ncbi:unnamed protein product, partial [Symbiodinium microadriaticum]
MPTSDILWTTKCIWTSNLYENKHWETMTLDPSVTPPSILPEDIKSLRNISDANLDRLKVFSLEKGEGVHSDADNCGWEKRIDKHLHYTKYDYNKTPFSLTWIRSSVQEFWVEGEDVGCQNVKDHDFQELVLALDPSLQELVDAVRFRERPADEENEAGMEDEYDDVEPPLAPESTSYQQTFGPGILASCSYQQTFAPGILASFSYHRQTCGTGIHLASFSYQQTFGPGIHLESCSYYDSHSIGSSRGSYNTRPEAHQQADFHAESSIHIGRRKSSSPVASPRATSEAESSDDRGHASVSSAVSASDETQPWNVMDTPILDGSSPPPVEGPIQDKIDPADTDKPILTKRDQLRLKSDIKSGPRRGRKGKRAKTVVAAVLSPPRRRRRLLRSSSRRSQGGEMDEEAEDDNEEKAPSKPRAKAKASAKAKAKAKASPKAKAKAKASAKAKAKASPKAKPKASAKAKAKAKASAKAKTTKRGRRAPPSEEGSLVSLEDGLWYYLHAEGEDDLKKQLLPLIEQYAAGTCSPEFKKDLKAATSESENFAFTMYWTRPAVGVQHKESGIEIGQISTGPKTKGSWGAKMAAVTDGAAMLGTFVEGLLGDGYIENTPGAFTGSFDIFTMKEFIKGRALYATRLPQHPLEGFQLRDPSDAVLCGSGLDGYHGDSISLDEAAAVPPPETKEAAVIPQEASLSDLQEAGLCRETAPPEPRNDMPEASDAAQVVQANDDDDLEVSQAELFQFFAEMMTGSLPADDGDMCSAEQDKPKRHYTRQEKFLARMHIVVTRKNSVDLIIEEAWYSKQEMVDDLGWTKINGAVRDCECKAATHIRRNSYDNELEYWVKIKESGTRKTSTSYEETHKQEKDVTDPNEMPDVGSLRDFSKIQDHAAATGKSPKKPSPVDPNTHKVKEKLDKMMDAVMAQISRTIATLEQHIKSLEAHYDRCQEAKLHSEVSPDEEPFDFKVLPSCISRNEDQETEKPRPAKKAKAAKPKKCSSTGHLVRRLSQDIGEGRCASISLGNSCKQATSVASSGIKSIGSTDGQALDDQIKYDLPAPGSLAGKVLMHAIRVMESLFRKHEPLIWKIGFTHSPSWRWRNELYGYVHSRDKWAGMVVLYCSNEQFGPAMLEAALIEKFKSILARCKAGCRNIKLGGDTVQASMPDAEATCTTAIKTARAVVKDLGDEKAGEIGLMRPDAKRERCIWAAFWEKYKLLEPAHPVFGMARNNEIDLSRTAAVVMHGDEGRGRRRQAFMVLSFHSLLGRGTNLSTKKAVKKPYLKMKLNFKGHSYCSRLLSGVLPKHMYQKDDEVFETLLRASCEDARTMMTEGVLDANGNRFWMVCLGTVGDWPFLQKSGHFTRTFANVVKRVDQVANGICHLCDCGPDALPFERFSTRRPAWLATLNATSPFETMPAAARIPHPPGQLAATFYFDLFHCWHLGVGRNFAGSALVLLSNLHAGNIDERFDLLTTQYKDWCRRNGAAPILTRINKDNIQWASTSEFPTGTWFKGQITTNIVRFFEDCDGLCDEPLFRLAIQAAQTINEFFRLLYSSDLWLPPEVARRAAELMFRFLRRPYPAVDMQRISEEAYFVLYEICPEGSVPAPSRVERLAIPEVAEVEKFTLVADGEMVTAEEAPAAKPVSDKAEMDELGPKPAKERTMLTTPVTELPDKEEEMNALPERKPIKGIPAVEFRARCDLIFEKYDKDKDEVLCFEELCSLMDAGGRRIEEYDAYASLCGRLGCDARVGLGKKDVYKLFEKAPQSVWEE